MAEKVVVEYDIQVTGAGELKSEVKQATALTKELSLEAKAAFNGKTIDDATKKLENHNKTVKQTNDAYKNVTSELKALTNQIASGKLEGKELQSAIKRAAELKDKIGDVREEINRLSSDTRKIDLLAEGARGVAGAFAVAQAGAALLGNESEELQKSILKAQAALTALTGVQELATIATKEGGIASLAYGKAQEAVAAISKVTGASIAASWALATAGITLVIGAIVYLISQMGDADDEAGKLNETLEAQTKTLNNLDVAYKQATGSISDFKAKELKINADFSEALAKIKRKDFDTDADYQKAILNQREIYYKQLDLLQANKNQKENDLAKAAFEAQLENIKDAQAKELAIAEQGFEAKKDALINEYGSESQLSEELSANIQAIEIQKNQKLQEINDKYFAIAEGIRRQQDKDRLAAIEAEAKRQMDIEEMVIKEAKALSDKWAKLRQNELDASIQKVKDAPKVTFDISVTANNKPPEIAFKEFADGLAKTLNDVKPFIDAFAQLTSNIFASQTQAIKNEKEEQQAILDENYQAELKKAGDNAVLQTAIKANYEKKKQAIEREAAIKSAKIARDQAILERSLALFNIVLNTANAISKLTAGLPFTLPQIILTGVLAAAQTASVLAAPLPTIPKFSKGVIKLNGKGTETSDDIPAFLSKGESVMTAKATNRYEDELQAAQDMRLEQFIMEKYLAPALRAAKIELQNEIYDDALLRHTIRKSNQENTKEIVKAVKESSSWNNYANNRYYN